MLDVIRGFLLLAVGGLLAPSGGMLKADRSASGADPPVISPFGQAPAVREDAIPGYVEISDGTVHPGQIYLTRDKRLKIFDEQLKRQREIPLRVVKQIECKVKKEWMEKEWKFNQAASDQKMFTGRTYPVREYLHTITLRDARTITGSLSGIIYVQPDTYIPTESGVYRARVKPQRYLLSKRNKGKIGNGLKSLVYVKLIKLGEKALAEGRKKVAEQRSSRSPGKPRRGHGG